jgi:hypothetical protein
MSNPHRDRQRRQDRASRHGGEDFHNKGFGDAFKRRYGKIDVSLDGIRQQDPNRHPDPQQQRQQQQQQQRRPRLEFRELTTLQQGDCNCRITAAEGQHGRIYNFTVERMGRDRPSRFFRDTDGPDLAVLIERATAWIAKQKSTT